MRPVTLHMARALAAGRPLLLLAEIDHPSGVARFWSGVGTLPWNGYTWTGAGRLGTVSPIRHTSDLKIQEIAFTLSGVSPDDVAELDDDVRNRSGKAWLACLDENGNVVSNPVQIVDAQLDYQSFSADDNSVITITARTGFYTLERALDERWSTEDQKRTYASDSGLDLLAELQNKSIQWKPAA